MTDHFDFDPEPDHHGADGGPEPMEPHDWVDDLVEDWDDAGSPDLGSDVLADIDPDAAPTSVDAGPVDHEVADGPIDLSFDEQAPADPWVAELDGSMDGAALRDALVAVGLPEAAEALAGVDVLEPRGAASVLDAAGLHGRVEHADIGTVVEAVIEGHDVVLVGPDRRSFAVASVDVTGDALVVDPVGGGERVVVSLRDFTDTWALVDHEALFVAAPVDGPVRLGGDTWVVAVDAGALQPPVGSDPTGVKSP